MFLEFFWGGIFLVLLKLLFLQSSYYSENVYKTSHCLK